MLKKPEPAINTNVAAAIECAYLVLRSDADLLERDGASYGVLGHLLKASGWRHTQGISSLDTYADGGGLTVINKAKNGDKSAHEALCQIAYTMLDRGDQWPVHLARYFLEVSIDGPPKFKRGQRPYVHIYRDTLICLAVMKVCKEFDIPRTRNKAKKPGKKAMSGCAIVQAAMARLHKEGLIRATPTEDTIEKISDGMT